MLSVCLGAIAPVPWQILYGASVIKMYNLQMSDTYELHACIRNSLLTYRSAHALTPKMHK